MGLGLRPALRRAFAMPPSASLTDAESALLDRVASEVARRGMRDGVLVALESLKPLGGVGGQAMRLLTPLASSPDWDRAAALLERRQGIEGLIERLSCATMPAQRA